MPTAAAKSLFDSSLRERTRVIAREATNEQASAKRAVWV